MGLLSALFRSSPLVGASSPRTPEPTRRQVTGLDPSLLTIEQQVIAVVSPGRSIDEINSIIAGDLSVVSPRDPTEPTKVPCIDRAIETDPVLSYPVSLQCETLCRSLDAPCLSKSITSSPDRNRTFSNDKETRHVKDVASTTSDSRSNSIMKRRSDSSDCNERLELIIGESTGAPSTLQPTCGFCSCFVKGGKDRDNTANQIAQPPETVSDPLE